MSPSLASLEHGLGTLLVALVAAAILRAGHSGVVGDYLLWIAAGIWAFTLT